MMGNIIIDKTHPLGIQNFYQTEHTKKQIIIGNTFSHGLNHIFGWENRLNGKYKITAPITILRDGTIYQHYDPKYYSDFMGIKDIDMNSIPIVLENQGWLIKDLEDNRYITWVGDIYNKENGIVEKKWRNKTYWVPYTNEQINSLVDVCKYLCDRFGVIQETLNHNTIVSDVRNFEGVTYRSNFSKFYSDVNPTFLFDEFKNKLELK